MQLLRILLFFLFFSAGNAYAQGFMRIDPAEFVGDNIEGKTLLKNISKAKRLFKKGESSFTECLNFLLECNKFNSNNAELNYNIGQSYLKYGKKDLAKSYFEQVKVLKPNINAELYLFLGQACQFSNDFSNAILNYKTYVEILQHEGARRNTEKLSSVFRYIDECKSGQILSEQSADFNVEKLPSPINSEANDILAIKDGSKLFFNSDRIIVGDKKKNKDESSLRGFSVALINGEWANFSILNDEKKSRYLPMMVAKVDDNQYLFYDKYAGFGDLIFMQKSDKYWIKEMDVFFMNKLKSDESSASFTADGNTVVFVSDRDENQTDIFYSQKDNDGEWSDPIKLGDQINSKYDERDVFLSNDGKVMYFSSKGRNTIGGYDIFKSEKDEGGSWMQAKNMGVPINSAYDDRHFFPYEGDSFLFDSDRGENGKFDIYSKKLIVETVVEDELVEPIKILEKIEPVIPVEKIDILPEVIPVSIPVVEKVKILMTTYKIQIAASKIAMKTVELKKIYRGKHEVVSSYDGEWYRYTIGNFDNIEDAIYFKDRLDVGKAFVVSFENETRKKIITNYSLFRK
ncbi:hypothetical protein ACXR6G_09050 [Ancylomarina sp. YFZ004]